MDTQGMSLPGKGDLNQEVVNSPFIPKKINAFTDMERKELKEIIHEVLDERQYRKEDDSWLYRGTY